MTHRRGNRGPVLVLGVLLGTGLGVATACGNPTTVLPVKEPDNCKLQVANMTVLASQRINPTVMGEPRPVQLRIYQLRTDTRLLYADFEKVWKDDKGTLKDDLVRVEEVSIYPDSRTNIAFERDEQAMFVAAVALFRNPTGRSWWTAFEFPPAPGKGNCGMPKCAGGECSDAAAGPVLNPEYVVWVDGTRVDEGEDHLEDYPGGVWPRQVDLHLSSPPKGGDDSDKGDKGDKGKGAT